MLEKKICPKLFYTTAIGNLVEHFDRALFALLAPFIAPLFFPKTDPLVALILIYLPLGTLARPIGAFYWGKVAQKWGPKKVFYQSLLGMSSVLILTACLPTHKSLGILSAIILHFFRALLCFFASGEGPSASLLLIHQANKNQKDLFSSYYEMSSIFGSLLASALIAFLAYNNWVLLYWRSLFLFCGLMGFLGLKLRKKILFEDLPKSPFPKLPFFTKNQSYLPLIAVILVTGFICSNYKVATHLINAYVPLFSSIKSSELLTMHTLLMGFDFCLLPVFGFLSQKMTKERLMMSAFLIFVVGIFPLLAFLQKPSLFSIFALRLFMITLGIAISAPFNAWAISILPKENTLGYLALSRSIGAQCIGQASLSLSLLGVHLFGWKVMPFGYVLFFALASFIFLTLTYKSSKKENASKVHAV